MQNVLDEVLEGHVRGVVLVHGQLLEDDPALALELSRVRVRCIVIVAGEHDLLIEVVRLPSATLEDSLPLTTRIEKTLGEFPEVRTVFCKTGRPEIANDIMGVQQTDVWVMLKPHRDWPDGVTRDQLVWARDAYVREDSYRQALAILIDAQHRLPIASVWGGVKPTPPAAGIRNSSRN